MGKNPDIPDQIFENFVSVFWVKNTLMQDPDPGSMMQTMGISKA
jgi:hypothetical protein